MTAQEPWKLIIFNYRAMSRNKTITAHWRKYQEYRDEIACFIQMNTLNNRRRISPAVVTIEAYYKGKMGVDASNIDDKMIIDGLMKAGILKDDDPTENPEVVKRSFVNTGENKLIIIVKNPR